MPLISVARPFLPTLWVGILVALLAGALAVRYGLPSEMGGPPDVLPPDIAARGTSVTVLGPDGFVSRDRAMEVARGQVGTQFDGAKVDAYLVAVTDPTTAGLENRAVWIVKVSGILIEVTVHTANGPAGEQRPGVAYVYVDALTGDWISTTEEWGPTGST